MNDCDFPQYCFLSFFLYIRSSFSFFLLLRIGVIDALFWFGHIKIIISSYISTFFYTHEPFFCWSLRMIMIERDKLRKKNNWNSLKETIITIVDLSELIEDLSNIKYNIYPKQKLSMLIKPAYFFNFLTKKQYLC